MGFFDQIGKKASDTMQTAKEKTNKFSAEMKLKSKFSERKDRINVLYSEIGKEVYSNYVKGVNENTDSIIEKAKEITEINKELQDINKEILSLKGIKICPNCSSQIPVGSEFCPKCGNKVVEVSDKVPDTVTTVEAEVKEVESTEEVKDENNNNE